MVAPRTRSRGNKVAYIVPVLNGQDSPLFGSFVIGPDVEGGLKLDGHKIIFRFKEEPAHPGVRVETSNQPLVTVLTMINASPIGAALDMEGYQVGGQAVVLHLAFTSIGTSSPHRVVTYTMSAARDDS
jgi:hypothetical protein